MVSDKNKSPCLAWLVLVIWSSFQIPSLLPSLLYLSKIFLLFPSSLPPSFFLLWCVCVWAHVCVSLEVSSSIVLHQFLKQGLSVNLELTDLLSLPVSPRGSSCLYCCHSWLFTWVLRSELRSSCLYSQGFTSRVSSPFNDFYSNIIIFLHDAKELKMFSFSRLIFFYS